MAAVRCNACSNPLDFRHFLVVGHWTASSPSSSRKRPDSNSRPRLAFRDLVIEFWSLPSTLPVLDLKPAKYTIHDLRHSYASRALTLGESLTMIGKLLGHTQVQTTARYAHLARDSIQTAAARITGSIGGNLSFVPGADKTAKQ